MQPTSTQGQFPNGVKTESETGWNCTILGLRYSWVSPCIVSERQSEVTGIRVILRRSLSTPSTLPLHGERYPRQVTLECPEISHCMSKRRPIIVLVDRAWLSAIQNATNDDDNDDAAGTSAFMRESRCHRRANSRVANQSVLRHR